MVVAVLGTSSGDVMPNQKSNAGNEGDVMKHPPLQKVAEQHSNANDEFWYVETHAAYPYYFLPSQGAGIGHLVQNQPDLKLLTDFANVAYHDIQNVHVRFPDKRTYLGSAAQVFHLLKRKQKRVRMTLFELDASPAQKLFEYFQSQGAKAVLVRTGSDAGVAGFLRQWWDAAVAKTQRDDFVMVVQGDSYKLAPALWTNGVNGKPDLVFVDPFKIGDSMGQPQKILSSLNVASVPFMCWTPLSCVPNGWPAQKWTFENYQTRTGNRSAQSFVRDCVQSNYDLAWICWATSAGSTRQIYGCQLTFGNVFGGQFTPAAIWLFPNGMPYLDLNNLVDNLGPQGLNFQNPITSWQTPGQPLIPNAAHIQIQNQPGTQWWSKYHAAFCWP